MPVLFKNFKFENVQALQAVDITWYFGQSSEIQLNEVNEANDNEQRMQKAMQKVLRCKDFSFKSREQEEALRTIMCEEQKTPLVVQYFYSQLTFALLAALVTQYITVFAAWELLPTRRALPQMRVINTCWSRSYV